MLSIKASLALIFSAAFLVTPALALRTTNKAPANTRSHGTRKAAAKKIKSHKLHGQQTIDSSRATEIQQALIREHYLNGEPTGTWDTTTQAAMQKFQGDQGWQTRLTPDSRALKKLGLGPDYSGAINAAGSKFGPPAPVSSIPSAQTSGFAAAAGINQ